MKKVKGKGAKATTSAPKNPKTKQKGSAKIPTAKYGGSSKMTKMC